MIRKFQCLVKLFCLKNHVFMHFNRFGWIAVHKLLYFLELVNSKDTPDFSAWSACFFTEARRDPCVEKRKFAWFDPFVFVKSWNRLFWCGYQIKWFFIFFLNNCVKIFFKVTELASRFHNALLHKERGLNRCVVFLSQERKTKVKQGLI